MAKTCELCGKDTLRRFCIRCEINRPDEIAEIMATEKQEERNGTAAS